MANQFDTREHGTVVSWAATGIGRIRADNGDSIILHYWSILEGFHQLTIGQRVEFSRTWIGLRRTSASLVVPLPTDFD
jgi:cold shock CspA family protein